MQKQLQINHIQLTHFETDNIYTYIYVKQLHT